jgi:FkbM family methyltransferase
MIPPILRHLFQQFSFFQALRLSIAEALARFFDKYNNGCYSFSGEDKAIAAIMPADAKHFYVDVGCNQPDLHSNTFAFYRRGWRGICVDANEKLIARHRALRIHDRQVLAAVSDVESEIVFTIFDDCDLISTMNPEVVERQKARTDAREVRMRTRTLSSILDELQAPQDFGLLSIDVEGQDFSVLRSLDWQRYRPQLVIVELWGLSLDAVNESELCQWLCARGYKLVGYLVFNAYFLRIN